MFALPALYVVSPLQEEPSPFLSSFYETPFPLEFHHVFSSSPSPLIQGPRSLSRSTQDDLFAFFLFCGSAFVSPSLGEPSHWARPSRSNHRIDVDYRYAESSSERNATTLFFQRNGYQLSPDLDEEMEGQRIKGEVVVPHRDGSHFGREKLGVKVCQSSGSIRYE